MRAKDIIERKFSRAFRGYDVSEVDAFLDEILRDQERMEQEMQLLELRNKMLLDELAGTNPDYLPNKKTEKGLESD
ncbi:MAG: DivIVA domain-containing protein [Candidatus Pelethousia sp.]|nr:DivIVA domain-containing protein [Candidatus Pelethousia sp.]